MKPEKFIPKGRKGKKNQNTKHLTYIHKIYFLILTVLSADEEAHS
jgi:hypothetical protein